MAYVNQNLHFDRVFARIGKGCKGNPDPETLGPHPTANRAEWAHWTFVPGRILLNCVPRLSQLPVCLPHQPEFGRRGSRWKGWRSPLLDLGEEYR